MIITNINPGVNAGPKGGADLIDVADDAPRGNDVTGRPGARLELQAPGSNAFRKEGEAHQAFVQKSAAERLPPLR